MLKNGTAIISGHIHLSAARDSSSTQSQHQSQSPQIRSAHHEVYVVVLVSEVLHQLLKALFLSTHLQKNPHLFVKLQLAKESNKNI